MKQQQSVNPSTSASLSPACVLLPQPYLSSDPSCAELFPRRTLSCPTCAQQPRDRNVPAFLEHPVPHTGLLAGAQPFPLKQGCCQEGQHRGQAQGRCVWGGSEAAEESLQLGGRRMEGLGLFVCLWPAKRSFLLTKRSFLLTILQLLFDLSCTFSWKASSILRVAMKLSFFLPIQATSLKFKKDAAVVTWDCGV